MKWIAQGNSVVYAPGVEDASGALRTQSPFALRGGFHSPPLADVRGMASGKGLWRSAHGSGGQVCLQGDTYARALGHRFLQRSLDPVDQLGDNIQRVELLAQHCLGNAGIE